MSSRTAGKTLKLQEEFLQGIRDASKSVLEKGKEASLKPYIGILSYNNYNYKTKEDWAQEAKELLEGFSTILYFMKGSESMYKLNIKGELELI